MPLTNARLVDWMTPNDPKTGRRPYREWSEADYMTGVKSHSYGCEYMAGKPCRVYLDWDKKVPVSDCYGADMNYLERHELRSVKEQIADALRKAPLLSNRPYSLLTRKPRLVEDGKKVKFSYRIIFTDLITESHTSIPVYLKACGYANNEPFDLSPYDENRIINAVYCSKKTEPEAGELMPYYKSGEKISNMLITMYEDTLPMINWGEWMPKPKTETVAVEAKKKKKDEAPAEEEDAGLTVRKVNILLSCISSACDYKEWLEILMAVKSILGDSDEAYTIADEWSALADSYDPRAFGRSWSSIKDIGKYTMGTLVFRAKKENPEKFKTEFADVFKRDRSYDDIKTEFEERVFKIINPVCFYQFKSNGDFTITSSAKIKETYCDMFFKGKDKEVSFIETWLKDPKKRSYEYVEFDPTMTVGKHIYNSFTGFRASKLEATAGVSVEPIIDHFKLLFKEHYMYVVKWFAQIVQYPNKKPNVCLIFQSSKEGAGKTILVNWFAKKVLGERYYRSITDPANDLFSKHGNGINERLLINLEEAQGQGFRPYMDRFKELITGDKYRIEPKGVDAYEIPNYCSFVANTNNDNPIPISATDRRFCAFNCDHDKVRNEAYFSALAEVMGREEVARAFYDYLMTLPIDIANFQEARPETDYYKELKRTNIPNWAKYFSKTADTMIGEKGDEAKSIYSGSCLYADYMSFCLRCKYEALTNTGFALKVKKMEGIDKQRSNGMKYILNWGVIKAWLVKENVYDEDVF